MMRICGLMILIVGLIAFAGCGHEDENNVEAFPGLWSWGAGSSLTMACPGETFSYDMSGNLTISEASSSDLVMEMDPCTWQLDVDGNRARINAGQQCNYQGDGLNFIETWSNLTLSESGDSLNVSGNGNVNASDGTNQIDCPLTIAGSLTKL